MGVDRQITILLPTSPVWTHPSTEVIEETIGTIRERLPLAEILLMCDGPHPSLDTDRVRAYNDYLQAVCWKAQHQWGPCLPIIHDTHQHQVRMTRHALGLVRTPYVQWCEHDTPLVGEFPYPQAVDALASGQVNLIRQYHETIMQPDHEPLMISPVEDVCGVPLRRTVQWSSRPHLASTGFYRMLLGADWWKEHDGMTEDRLFSVVQSAWLDHGQTGYDQFRLGLWHPDGNIQGSRHLDGRGPDDKVILRG